MKGGKRLRKEEMEIKLVFCNATRDDFPQRADLLHRPAGSRQSVSDSGLCPTTLTIQGLVDVKLQH